jgi:hypothetical protein
MPSVRRKLIFPCDWQRSLGALLHPVTKERLEKHRVLNCNGLELFKGKNHD